MTELLKGEPNSSESTRLSISFKVKSCDLPASSYSVFSISIVHGRFDKMPQTLLCRQPFAQVTFRLACFSGARLLIVLRCSLRFTRSEALSRVGPQTQALQLFLVYHESILGVHNYVRHESLLQQVCCRFVTTRSRCIHMIRKQGLDIIRSRCLQFNGYLFDAW